MQVKLTLQLYVQWTLCLVFCLWKLRENYCLPPPHKSTEWSKTLYKKAAMWHWNAAVECRSVGGAEANTLQRHIFRWYCRKHLHYYSKLFQVPNGLKILASLFQCKYLCHTAEIIHVLCGILFLFLCIHISQNVKTVMKSCRRLKSPSISNKFASASETHAPFHFL